jgi:hypothetical protein
MTPAPRTPGQASDDHEILVGLTARELHVLTCAMAGNHPPTLNDVRMPTLRKLAKASRALKEAADA